MKLERLVGERFKEKPADCTVESHALMVRGGYMKYVANGIFSSFMPLKRVTRKLEAIMRGEMDAIDGQEVSFPVVMPASIWQESGRYETIGKELVRFNDRNGSPVVLGMTHEEAAVQLVREYGQSYNKYPFMIYQIQTKFRDEARPKSGLIRVREFTMKDAYSFHTSQADLEQYYDKCHKAYERIFAKAGIPEVVSVASDSGMMGGKISHEFMLLTDIGEDSIVICPECGYRANMEAAPNIIEYVRTEPSQDLAKVHTPDMHTIEEVCNFFDSLGSRCMNFFHRKHFHIILSRSVNAFSSFSSSCHGALFAVCDFGFTNFRKSSEHTTFLVRTSIYKQYFHNLDKIIFLYYRVNLFFQKFSS